MKSFDLLNAFKKSSSYIFERILWRFRKLLENFQKNIFRSILLKTFKLLNTPTYNYTENWLHHKCLLCLLYEFSKLVGERLLWNHFWVKQQNLLQFVTLSRNLTRTRYVLESSFSKNFETSSFNRSSRLLKMNY